jgi:hypothetical protein
MKCKGQIFIELAGGLAVCEEPLYANSVLCPHCDKTHFGIFTADKLFTMKLDLDPEEAEALAAALINPVPAPVGA